MDIQDYPAQETPSEIGGPYIRESLRISAGLAGIEEGYGPDIHQRVLAFPAPEPNGSVLVFMYGGGWTNGYKEMMSFIAPGLNAAGIGFVSAGYRLAPAQTFPAPFLDAADAVAWTFGRASHYGWSEQRIFVGGHSAGGHLAALLATRRDWQGERSLPENVIKGALPISGTFDLTPCNGFKVRPRFLGPIEEANELPASPCFNVGNLPVPLLIAWGESDFPHLIQQAKKMVLVQQAKGGLAQTLELPDADHIAACYRAGDIDGPWQRAAIAFMTAL